LFLKRVVVHSTSFWNSNVAIPFGTRQSAQLTAVNSRNWVFHEDRERFEKTGMLGLSR
jgi:hypothetical protein